MANILIVDDEAAIADLIQLTLAQAGHKSETAMSGSEAADKLDAAKAEQQACIRELDRLKNAEQAARKLEEQQTAALERTQALADGLAAALTAAQAVEQELTRWSEAKENMAEVRSRMRELVKLQKSEQAARGALEQASDGLDKAQQAYMSADQLFRRDQAGLLAKDLTPGQPCPVCGSVHHPSPARGVTDAPDKEELDALAAAMEAARTDYNNALQASSTLTAQAGSAREQYIRQARQVLAGLEQELPPEEDAKTLSRLLLDWDERLDQLLKQAEAAKEQRQAQVEAASAAMNQLADDRKQLDQTRQKRSDLQAQAAQAAGASQQQNPGAGAQQQDNNDGETVEAEFREEDNK